MQRTLRFRVRSHDEDLKDAGLVLDFDEIARRGAMSADETVIAKWYGIYNMRQPGNHMARVVVPGGLLTSAQARALAKIAEDYAQGRLAFTTRQDVQLHWLKCARLPDFLRDLRAAGLSTFHGCGDVNRNVVACPWAGTCRWRRFDVLPDAIETSRAILQDRELDNLPRKHKISFSGCGAGCAQPYMNDIGLIAVAAKDREASRDGFRVLIGGGHGWRPAVARELFSFVPRRMAVEVCKAVARLFRDHGDRFDRARARLKFVVERLGIEECRRIVVADLWGRGVDTREFRTDSVEDTGPAWPARPLTEPDPAGTDGLHIVRARVDRGELRFHELTKLAELSEVYGDKRLRVTQRQNVEIHGVRPADVEPLREAIRGIGFATDGLEGLQDVVPCVGTTFCPLAVSRTHDLFDLLRPVVDDPKYESIRDAVLVNITGCPNSCSPYRVVDIGFRGARIRQDLGSVEGYEVSLGGTQDRHGEVLGEFRLEDCPAVTRAILDTFLALRNPPETLADQVRRVGVEPYRDAIERLGLRDEKAPPLAAFTVAEGLAFAERDHRAYARDIPCEAACPAGTRVPHYIEAIAKGDLDRAYRINQEDNVFPGVLGRICSRPCEPACRHNRTGSEGAVAICHLKRYAADERPEPKPTPLPAWFPRSGRRVAVVGSGPAGLAAARELVRYGHEVVVFEREQVLGGMMRLAIPSFRLPRDVLDAEIAAILDSGVQVRLGEAVTPERISSLLAEFDAVVLAAGAIEPAPFGLPGLEPRDAAIPGVVFMRKFNLGQAEPPRAPVLVIGGGYTAVDCARAARRLLGPDGGEVQLMYRRTTAEMSATPAELEEMARERIRVETLVSPVEAKMQDGRVVAVIFEKNRLTARDPDTGRPGFEPLPGSRFEVPCGTLIAAIGQRRTLRLLPDRVEHRGLRTTRAGLFVAGDFSYGSRDVIHAVADGKKVADEVDLYLMGRRRRQAAISIQAHASGWTGRVRDHDLISPPPMPTASADRRSAHGEVELGFGPEDARLNALRCYLCQYRYEIDQDKCIHCDWCIKVAPRDCIKKVRRVFFDPAGGVTDYVETELPRDATYIYIESDNCIRCGACLRICPTGAISCRKMERVCVSTMGRRGDDSPMDEGPSPKA